MRISDWSSDVCSSDVEIGGRRLFVDADGAVALHVRMAPDRRDSRAGLAEIPLQQQRVRDLLHKLRSHLMLGDPHAIAADRRFSIGSASCRVRECQYA